MDLEDKDLTQMYRKMLEIRRFEEKAIELYMKGIIQGYLHPYIGEEAIAVGACFALDEGDYITSTHRGHGHCIAKGGDLKLMMAELMAKETGYCKGRGGSMHIADADRGILGANGIVGGGIPIAVGAAMGCRNRGNGRVVACFFGDGAVNNGIFHESLNLASIWKLPVVFICENNLYAVSTPMQEVSALKDVSERAIAYGIPGVAVDGNDVLAVYEIVKEAVSRAGEGKDPSLIEGKSYRHTGHNINDPGTYRTAEEIAYWKSKDPIVTFRAKLLERNLDSEERIKDIEREVDEAIDKAVEYALASPEPSLESFIKELWECSVT